MDVMFVSEPKFPSDTNVPYMGQLILRDIIKKDYKCEILTSEIACSDNLKEKNIEKIIDNMSSYVIKKMPRIIDFYTVCESFPMTILLAVKVAKFLSDSTIIFSGPHASLLSEECLKELKFVDIVAYTEGELVIKPLVKALVERNSLLQVPGICYRDENGDIVKNSMPPLVAEEKLHDYFVKDFSPYVINPRGEIMLEGGRGCPFNCTFCSTSIFWQRNARLKPAEHVIAEIEFYYNKYRVKRYGIVHDLFTSNRKYILDFCKKISEANLEIEWTCSVRLDTIDEVVLKNLSEANCTGIYIGIESGSSRMQKILNKNLELSRVLNIVETCKELKIEAVFSFIMGFPDENIDDFYDTVDLIEKIYLLNIKDNTIQLHMFSPYPATDETDKIQNQLSLPENINYLPETQAKYLSAKVRNTIIKYSKLCTAFLNFDSEVRKAFCEFHTFIEIIETTKQIFRYSLINEIRENGLLSLYALFTKYYNQSVRSNINSDYDYNRDNVYIMARVFEDCCGKVTGYEKSIYKYELLLSRIICSETKKYCCISTIVDFELARCKNEIIFRDCKYLLYGKELNIEISSIENEHDFLVKTELLKASGYTIFDGGEKNEL